jgi:site-specific DNA recombinase
MRAVAYVRVSSVSQVDGHSLDAQERLFYELCKSRKWEAVKVYREEGRSAHVEAISRRPVFRQLLEDAGKSNFDVVVVHTLDRWSRNQRVMLDSISMLAKANVSLVSITENIDYSTPQGKLFTQMLGSFAEYFSGALANHISKGLDQRANEGKHTGGIPFGYESCWTGEKGDKQLRCNPEHPAGIHVHVNEGPVVTELFRRYASGNTILSQLAAWLNEQGFRTRNMHRLLDATGNLTAGPKLFTVASVRGILHNPFYTGKISHRGKLLPGLHEPLISPDIFETVQATLKKNSGRSETLQVRPERLYLLKGIGKVCLLRDAYVGTNLPEWQTFLPGA